MLPPTGTVDVKKKMEREDEGDREESCGSCRRRATAEPRCGFMLMGSRERSTGPGGTVEILSDPFPHFFCLVFTPFVLYIAVSSPPLNITLCHPFFLDLLYIRNTQACVHLHSFQVFTHLVSTFLLLCVYSNKPGERNPTCFIYCIVTNRLFPSGASVWCRKCSMK